jgi:uncharacterized Zn-binding protein involved in type VI secretion
MKRDMELVRKILLAMEADPHGFAADDFTIAGYGQEVIGHHVWLMEQGNLITASATTVQRDGSPVALPGTITWIGHDFLAVVRNDTVWAKVKVVLKDKGLSLPFTLLQELALKILAAHVGLPFHE